MNEIDMSVWTGRCDTGEGELATRWHQEVKPASANPEVTQTPGIALVGFACDEGVRRNQGRVGAVEAPGVLRKALANLAWHQTAPVYDAGDVSCLDADLDAAQQRLGQRVAALIAAGHAPLVLGGGHETAFGTYLGLAAAHPDKVIGIANLDAHFDLREAIEASSGTPFKQIADLCEAQGRPFRYLCWGVAAPSNTQALYARAEALQVQWRPDSALTESQLPQRLAELDAFVASVDLVYLTIDLDVLPAGEMPAVSAPAAFGVPLAVIETVATRLAGSGKLAAADLVEFNPRFDQDSHGAKSAARLAWSIARHWRR
ncbi:formimidoylglutamase [Crenobacter cavernae]|uniref:Formimidoylglutamase n=1 Tax=Crenobacter cavernae TaxID=2290923 RepID=A0ABY0FBL7_9NEIS|nr:formimidoylglutamase [Crenobacter cavernae]RXZ43446.1 formimidoylglutamase [Crenobacter cavernae]